MNFRSLLVGRTAADFWRHREKLLKARCSFVRRFHRLCCSRILYRNNASIEETTQIDGRFVTPHGLNGILISAGSKIGSGCTIFHQVTIGSNTLSDSKYPGSPVIGNHVYIGAGAKIIGGIRVGDGARIGANCVVVEDVPAGATVVLQRPRVILHNDVRDNTFTPISKFSE